MQKALDVLEARAQYRAPGRRIDLRVADLDGKIYLDLCDDDWQAVEIDSDGWRVIAEPPVRFRRTAGMLSLPAPVAGGTIDALKPFLNVATDDEFVLVVSVLLDMLRDRGPHPSRTFPESRERQRQRPARSCARCSTPTQRR